MSPPIFGGKEARLADLAKVRATEWLSTLIGHDHLFDNE